MVKTCQFTTKCKIDRVIAQKQQKAKELLNYNHKTHVLDFTFKSGGKIFT